MEQMEKCAKWTDEEVHALLSIYAEADIQREFDSTTRNDKLYRKISSRLAEMGVQHTAKQCREKIKKMKQDYKKVKVHNNQNGSERKTNKWFSIMDAILGHRPAYSGNAETKESVAASLELTVDDTQATDVSSKEDHLCEISQSESSSASSVPFNCPHPLSPMRETPHKRRKRKRDPDFLEAIREMTERSSDVLWQGYEQRERYFQLLIDHDAQEAAQREREFAVLREEAAEARQQQNAFQQGFLAIFDRLVQVLDKRNAPTAPSLD
ncbi:uncharacterized protein [Paramormyrops kingsleyae]